MQQESDWTQLMSEVVNCRLCPRLVEWREAVAVKKRAAYRDWDYWGRPVPGFGDRAARILIVGLAPAAHGGNRTGRVFTGDRSGDFLYGALHRFGFANQPEAIHKEDGLLLRDVYIAAVCRCAPPDNRPLPDEMLNCRPYLLREMALLSNLRGVVVLGKIAFDSVFTIFRERGLNGPRPEFTHAGYVPATQGFPWVVSSYHPSQQNTQTGRLTVEMFDRVWQKARDLLGD